MSECASYRSAGALVLVTLATVVYGCGSSQESQSAGPSGAAAHIKPEDYVRYEGEGKNKKKDSLDRREKRKLRFEKAKELEGK
jgi:hypothetical protein